MRRSKTIPVPKAEENTRLDKFLLRKFPNASYSNLQKLIRKKDIKVNGKRTSAGYNLNSRDIISVASFLYEKFQKSSDKKNQKTKKIPKKNIENFKKLIIYKDDNLIAINKPGGLPVQGGSKVKISVDDYLPHLKFNKKEVPKLVHRLDKDTTGVLLIARNRATQKKLMEAFKTKNKLKKIYLATVIGKLTKKSGTIKFPLIKKVVNGVEKVYKDEVAGKEAITKYKVLSYSKKYNVSKLEVQILTGRTHQIRVHMKEIGHPIIGDGKYGGKRAFVKGMENKLHLHAHKIFGAVRGEWIAATEEKIKTQR